MLGGIYMNNHQKVLVFGCLLAIILFSLIVWQKLPQDTAQHEVKTKEIEAIEKGTYNSMEEAQKALVNDVIKSDDLVSAIYTPNKKWKTPFYVIQVSYKENKQTYSGFAFVVPENGKYKLELADIRIKTYDGMQPIKDSIKIGENKVHIYVGTPLDNPFADSIRHSFVDDSIEVAFQVE